MTSPYSNLPPFHRRSQDSSSTRRPSYATVAAGTSVPPFQSLSGVAHQGSSTSNSRPQTRGEHSRNQSQDMESAEFKSRSRWNGEVLRYEDGLRCERHDQHPPFFTPSYLKANRHVQRLRRDWEDHLTELREKGNLAQPAPAVARQSSLSRSSSAANLGKTHHGHGHVHRGVAQDVIERLPSASSKPDESSRALPSRWSDEDKVPGLEILGNGTEVRYSGNVRPVTPDEAASIRSDYPMPKECGIYYYEVTILTLSKQSNYSLAIGFSGRKTVLNRLPGWENDSWAYHGDDGNSFQSSTTGKPYGPKFEAPDVVGCGVNFRTGTAFFTKNGVYQGIAFQNLKYDTSVYPSVGLKRNGDHIRTNFGQRPFHFDIDAMMMEERKAVRAELNKADAAFLHPPDDETALVNNLITQYLAHEGYIEASHAFAADLQEHAELSPIPRASFENGNSFALNADDDIHASQRQKIRRAILKGDIDRALKYTQSYYPLVLQDERNKELWFRLRCRKFIEMMRRYAELSSSSSFGRVASSETVLAKPSDSFGNNGHTSAADDGGAELPDVEEEMEIDDQVQSSLTQVCREDEMETSTSSLPKPMKANDLLTSVLQYGQELKTEFGMRQELSDIFAIVAYTNPAESIVGGLLDVRGRVAIAEGINGAILVSLGKPSSAALEKLAAQTETLLEATAAKVGGAAASVNVRGDYLSSS